MPDGWNGKWQMAEGKWQGASVQLGMAASRATEGHEGVPDTTENPDEQPDTEGENGEAEVQDIARAFLLEEARRTAGRAVGAY
jgi:hypothetical protein